MALHGGTALGVLALTDAVSDFLPFVAPPMWSENLGLWALIGVVLAVLGYVWLDLSEPKRHHEVPEEVGEAQASSGAVKSQLVFESVAEDHPDSEDADQR